MKYNLHRYRIDKIPKEEILNELQRIAKIYGYRQFSGREFDKISKKCRSTTVKNNFGSWDNALKAIGIRLIPYRNTRKDKLTNKELFEEMEHIWKKLGHRPSKDEWIASKPRYSYTTYQSHFKGWLNACAGFINYKSNDSLLHIALNSKPPSLTKQAAFKIAKEEKRNIPLKLRLQVLRRDNFNCVYCGRSPAIKRGLTLHIDHIKSFSKGGKTVLENLQTLCKECNLGKGK